MTLCDRCQTRPACCVVGATILSTTMNRCDENYDWPDAVKYDVRKLFHASVRGRFSQGVYDEKRNVQRGFSVRLQLCPVCSGRL